MTTFVGIAINGATGDDKHWPGPLRLIQTHAWPSVIVLTVVGIVVAIPLWRLSSESGDDAAPGISVGSGNVSQVTGSGTTNVTNIFGDVHHGSRQATPTSPEPAGDDRDVPGLPEFVPGTLHDRRNLLGDLTAKMTQPDGVFVELVGVPGIGKTAIVAELLRKRPDNVAPGYLAVRRNPE
ncbi:hypothetical protein Drose_35915 [Dactylosporangium roseum]|uniref:Orc1-like AAA ATPase domain-containing protein n=1 Tax=Dactylosporangium roseum TaxID=47989 RepID=A0ABY5Z3Z3_9ACTN|nr:hypothetical protein [Dactylosporangium roseum]UWZ36364.1 hypothetical protein Drose_35915 [Dactylosporangium roseum]